jgi:hypothetical protein
METHAGVSEQPARLRRGLREDKPIKIASCNGGKKERQTHKQTDRQRERERERER